MNDRMLVGLVGYPGAGKDTLADGLETLGWSRSAFADPMKQFLLRKYTASLKFCGPLDIIAPIIQKKIINSGNH